MNRRLLASSLVTGLAMGLVSFLSLPVASAADGGAPVTGSVELAPAAERGEPPRTGEGFVPRAKNPLKPPRALDPRGQIVIVLEGGPVDDSDKKPRARVWEIVGENFASDIFPVVVGSKVEIKNKGRKSPRLVSPTNPDIVPGDPINKNGVRATEAIAKVGTPVEIRDADSVHMVGHIVAFDHAYFALPSYDGKFTIEGVPPGTWKVKVWYRDGWLSIPETSVNVAAKRGAKGVKVKLPAKLPAPKAAAQEGSAQ